MLFRDRADWKDVTAVDEVEPADSVCPIAYSPEFADAMGYFRAVLASNERSQRTLELTRTVIAVNPANYTAWHFRRRILEKLGSDLVHELAEMELFAEKSPKNYQVWHHRQWCVEQVGAPGTELAFTAKLLLEDGKNYHIWAYRQWMVRQFNLRVDELAFTASMIEQDVRNNSAWNQRHWLVNGAPPAASADGTGDSVGPISSTDAEIEYTLDWIRKAPNNQSPWSYLTAFLDGTGDAEGGGPPPVADRAQLRQRLVDAVGQLADSLPVCAPARVFLFDAARMNNDAARARELAEQLLKLDASRARYWQVQLEASSSPPSS